MDVMPKSITTLLKQGLSYPKHFIGGRMQKSSQTKDNLKNNEGAVVEIEGKKVAAFKNDKGELTTLSPVCTHAGCIVGWNNSDKTWDCPCHGSRFEADGTVKNGPATKNLPKV